MSDNLMSAFMAQGLVPATAPTPVKSTRPPLAWLLGLAGAMLALATGYAAAPIIATRLVRYRTRLSKQKPQYVRSAFNNIPPIKSTQAKGHTHPKSAADRSSASTQFVWMAAGLGLEPYFYQQSHADQKLGRAGSRQHYWAKDMLVAERELDDDAEFYVMIDVDYYVDMPKFLAEHDAGVAIYSFVPSAAARSTSEYSYHVTETGEIQYMVTGGATYNHGLWDYGCDTLLIESWPNTPWWLGPVGKLLRIVPAYWKRCAAYNVDRKQQDQDHQMILFTPICTMSCFGLSLRWIIEGLTLKRLEPLAGKSKFGQFVRIQSRQPEGLVQSTGIAGTPINATVSAEVDTSLALQSKLHKVELSVAQVKTTTNKDDMSPATVLTAFHRSGASDANATTFSVRVGDGNFQFNPHHYEPEAKPSMVPFMSPFVREAYSPTVTESNDRQSIEGRVENVRAPQLELKPRLVGHMTEFAALLVKEPHVMRPVDVDYVVAKQGRPSQRAILEQALAVGGLSGKPVASFVKKEAYGKPTDPRNITTIPAQNKLVHSTFLYAFADLMRQQPWYAFGKTPVEIADRVIMVCRKAQAVAMTDLSRCDGRISNVLRHLERMVMLRAFAPAYHELLIASMETQMNQVGYTSHGIKYATGTSRLSGSPETADFNSLDNAFIAYHAQRNRGLTPEEAWSALGIYGGDDGLSADIPHDIYSRAASDVGQVLECEIALRGDRGVNFLARYYSPNVWHGDGNSIADFKRTIAKIHLTPCLRDGITPTHKIVEKCRGLIMTDQNTPVLGAYAASVLRLAPANDERTTTYLEQARVGSYWAQHPAEFQYPNDDAGGWMSSEITFNYPTFSIDDFYGWLNTCTTIEQLLDPPLFAIPTKTPAAAADMVVDGDIVRAAERCDAACLNECKEECQTTKQRAPRPSRGPLVGERRKPGHVAQGGQQCFDFVRGACKRGTKCKFAHTQ